MNLKPVEDWLNYKIWKEDYHPPHCEMKLFEFLKRTKPTTMNIDKKEAQKQLDAIKADVARLEAVINAPQDIKEVIKSYGDPLDGIFHLSGTPRKDFYAKCAGDTEDEIGWKEIKLIAKVLNEGSQPENNYYFPWFKKEGAVFVYCAYNWYGDDYFSVSPLGRYKTSELAIFAGKTFEKSYNKWSGINNK